MPAGLLTRVTRAKDSSMFLPAGACSSDIPRLSGPATHNPVSCTFNSNYQTATEGNRHARGVCEASGETKTGNESQIGTIGDTKP